jgi:hypothetical protein
MIKMAKWLSLAAVALLAACESYNPVDMVIKKEVPPCPKIVLLGDAAKLTKFRPGQGKDITDIDLEAEFLGFRGICDYKEKDGKGAFLMTVSPIVEISRGAANRDGQAEFIYFAAIPEEAKEIFVTKTGFPPNVSKIRFAEDVLEFTVPLKSGERGENITIYLGFQLNSDQLEYNRRQGK